MENRIRELLQKYWEAETSLDEERELRELLQSADGFKEEKALFQGLGQWSQLEPKLEKPAKTKVRRITPVWLNWAASLLILISTVWIWQSREQQKAEEQAYQEVMMALSMIQTNLAKGKESMKAMDDLKYLNTTQQIFKQEDN
ncbi:hypothetical protein ACFOSV_02380 [Algoriphagus namhaensis]|uniref:Anti-sigma factor n=1 Tax=Algoriphagus namhaensis TaxID=915353 RepID=A0ABV8AQ20_9BACT